MTAADALTPDGFALVQRETLERSIEVWPARAHYPFSIGHPCVRHQVWRFTRSAEQRRHEWVLQSIFDEGKLHQGPIYERLERMGFVLSREQDRPTQYKAGAATISGRPDGKVRGFRGEKYDPPGILEIKSASPHAWASLDTAEDIRTAPDHWTRMYYDQGMIYTFLENLPWGLFVLKNKVTGVLKAIRYDLDYARAEWLLKRVEEVQALVSRKEDPPPIPYDSRICGSCAFGPLCYPPRDMGGGTMVLEDAGLLECLEARHAARAQRDEYEAADRVVKATLKRMGVKSAICGPWTIEAQERPVKGFSVAPRVDTIYDIRRVE